MGALHREEDAKRLLNRVCYDGEPVLESGERVKHAALNVLSAEARECVTVNSALNPQVFEPCAAKDHPQLSCMALIKQSLENPCLRDM